MLGHVPLLSSFTYPECTSTVPVLSGWVTPESSDGTIVGCISGGLLIAWILQSVCISTPAQHTICRSTEGPEGSPLVILHCERVSRNVSVCVCGRMYEIEA